MVRPELPQRKTSLRHPGVDYRSHAAYFVTVCAYRRRCLFRSIHDGVMHCTRAGDIVWDERHRIKALRENVVLDTFVNMLDHVHGIKRCCVASEQFRLR
jgi:REP element-mobilizing transposase RayT